MIDDDDTCDHENLTASVEIAAAHPDPDNGEPNVPFLMVQAWCPDCGEIFKMRGVPEIDGMNGPSMDAQIMVLPLESFMPTEGTC